MKRKILLTIALTLVVTAASVAEVVPGKVPGSAGFVFSNTGFGITYDFKDLIKLPVSADLTFGGSSGNYGNIIALSGMYKILNKPFYEIPIQKKYKINFNWYVGAGLELTAGSKVSSTQKSAIDTFNSEYDKFNELGYVEDFISVYGNKFSEPDMFTAGVFPAAGITTSFGKLKVGKNTMTLTAFFEYKPVVGWLGHGTRASENFTENVVLVKPLAFAGGLSIRFN